MHSSGKNPADFDGTVIHHLKKILFNALFGQKSDIF